jgi:hypothetical protein
VSGVGFQLMPETGNFPLRLAYTIKEIERLSDFRSINIAFLRVERCGFQYFEGCEKVHDGGSTKFFFQAPAGRAGPWSA